MPNFAARAASASPANFAPARRPRPLHRRRPRQSFRRHRRIRAAPHPRRTPPRPPPRRATRPKENREHLPQPPRRRLLLRTHPHRTKMRRRQPPAPPKMTSPTLSQTSTPTPPSPNPPIPHGFPGAALFAHPSKGCGFKSSNSDARISVDSTSNSSAKRAPPTPKKDPEASAIESAPNPFWSAAALPPLFRSSPRYAPSLARSATTSHPTKNPPSSREGRRAAGEESHPCSNAQTTTTKTAADVITRDHQNHTPA